MAEFIPPALAVLIIAIGIGIFFAITKRDRTYDDTPYGDTTGWRGRE